MSVLVVAISISIYAVMRWGLIYAPRPLPMSFALMLTPFVWVRRRYLLWATSIGFVAISAAEHFFFFRAMYAKTMTLDAALVDFALFIVNVAAVTALIHMLISLVEFADRRTAIIARLNAELSGVWRTAPVGLALCNADVSKVQVNPAGCELLGLSPEDDVAQLLADRRLVAYRDSSPVPIAHSPLARAARDGAHIEAAEWELAGPSGQRVTVLLAAAPLRSNGDFSSDLDAHPNTPARGAPHSHAHNNGNASTPGPTATSGAVAAFVDISAVKQLQRELDLRRREAEEAAIRKSRFLSAVSHDIRTPANAISLLAELLARAAANPDMLDEIPRFAADLRASSQKLVDLVSDVLDFSKLDSSRVEVVETVFDLDALLDEELAQASVVAAGRGLPVRLARLGDPLTLRTDRVKLGRILGNLLSNAVKFTSEGEVVLEASRSPVGDLLIRVSDTGPGIPADSLGRIFDEFYQVRTDGSPPAHSGSGLGLAICRRLSAVMNMRLTVESEVGRGSTFTLAVPHSVIFRAPREPRNSPTSSPTPVDAARP
jgi:signal transduction histidine kinase